MTATPCPAHPAIHRLAAFALSALIAPAGAALDRVTVADPPTFHLAKGETREVTLQPGAADTRVELAASFPGSYRRLGRVPRVALSLTDSAGREMYRATLSLDEGMLTDGFDTRALRLVVDSVTPAGDTMRLLEYDNHTHASLDGGVNSLTMSLEGGTASFRTGSGSPVYAGSAAMRASVARARVTTGFDTSVARFRVSQLPDPAATLATEWTEGRLAERFADTSDPLEGYWTFLDRDNDPAWAVPGGFYTLAIARSPEVPGEYDAVYISGARVGAEKWRPGMRKGSLTATGFIDHYTLRWIDAEFRDDYTECTADLSADRAILTLSFPLSRSKMRFSRAAAPAAAR